MAVQYNAGRYVGEVIDQQLGKSKNKGTPQIAITFQIVGMVNEADPDGNLLSCDQHQRTVFMFITEKTSEFICENLAKLGFRGKSFSQIDLDDPQASSMVGNQAELYCKHEEYEGELKERWNLSRGAGRVEVVPLESKESRKLDAMFGKTLSRFTTEANGEDLRDESEAIPANDAPF